MYYVRRYCGLDYAPAGYRPILIAFTRETPVDARAGVATPGEDDPLFHQRVISVLYGSQRLRFDAIRQSSIVS